MQRTPYDRLVEPIDATSLAAFRIAFGLLMATSAARFLLLGWVERCFVVPRFFFKYYGFGFVEVGSPDQMVAAYIALAVLGVLIAVGLFYRLAIIGFFLLFTYVELIDVTNYLNHYYLVSLLSFLLCFTPANAAWSLDARLGLSRRGPYVPAWCLYLLRFQVGVVYVFAALAKIEPDWLLHAQPIEIWMNARTDTPIIGALLARHDVALFMSWAGFLNDLLAVPLLMSKRARPYAFVMLVVFHAFTGVFFNIGIFPILMPINATLFFDADWPRAITGMFVKPRASLTPPRSARLTRTALALIGAYCAVQVLLPLRVHLYGGNVLWDEQGMRWSWRVMLRKKAGSITYLVRVPSTGRRMYVSPRRYLTNQQEQEFSGQPDLILQLAHHVAAEFRERMHEDVEVRVDALVSLNGRPAVRMIDPDVDLAHLPDSCSPATYILDAPTSAPARLDSSGLARAL